MGSFVISEGDYEGWDEQPKLPWSLWVPVMLLFHIPEQITSRWTKYYKVKLMSLLYVFIKFIHMLMPHVRA